MAKEVKNYALEYIKDEQSDFEGKIVSKMKYFEKMIQTTLLENKNKAESTEKSSKAFSLALKDELEQIQSASTKLNKDNQVKIQLLTAELESMRNAQTT